MLVHRLPSDPSILCSLASNATEPEIEPLQRLPIHRIIYVLASIDLFAVLAAGSGVMKYGFNNEYTASGLMILAAWVLTWFLAALLSHLYEMAGLVSGRSMIPQAFTACGLAFAPMVILASTAISCSAASMAPSWLYVSIPIAMIIGVRFLADIFLRAAILRGYCLDRVLIAAPSLSTALAVAGELETRTRGRIRAAAAVQFPGSPGGPSFSWLENALETGSVDRILVPADRRSAPLEDAFRRLSKQSGIDVGTIPDFASAEPTFQLYAANGELTIIDGGQQPLSNHQSAYKRTTDILVAAVALTLLTPPLLAIALIIKLDSNGPIFFRQTRSGLSGATFRMWKFRTMYHHLTDERAVQQTCRCDRRVTRVGRILRRTSLDELPQLINVLRGEMSIVGPRPHALGMTVEGRDAQKLIVYYNERHRMKPGITGWAQINGCRGELDTVRKLRRRVALDCYYIENWSLSMDLLIMIRTIALLLVDRHAY